jgi:uncharacterized protein
MNRNLRFTLLAILLLIAGFDAGLLVGPSLNPRNARPAPAVFLSAPPATGPALLSGVPDVRQSTVYSCGAAALQAVMSYYGLDRRERALMDSLKTSEEAGTSPANIVRVAEENGFRAVIREGLILEDLEEAVRGRIPVIADIQAWTDATKSGFSWGSDWEDGHYVVVIGIDRENVYVEDPSLLGTRGVIPRAEFVERWRDYEGAPPHDASDRSYVRAGIFITGREPVPQPAITKVD